VRRPAVAAALFLLVAHAANAHDTWIAPRAFRVASGATLTVDMTSGMGFPALEYAPEAARIESAGVRLQGRVLDFGGRTRGARALVLTARPDASGLAAIFVSTKPRTLTLKPSQVTEYLEEIGAAQEIVRAWRERKGPKTWRESYRKHAKAFVRVGEAPDAAWTEPVGLPLEIVPERDPSALRAGSELTLRVLKQGEPVPEFAVAAVMQGTPRRLVRTGPDGRATLPLDRAGVWLLAGTELRPSGDAWESDFTTLTLEVQP
jgi:uncharacterized protein DUF4198